MTPYSPTPTMAQAGFMLGPARLSLEAYKRGDLQSAYDHLIKADKISPHVPEYKATIAVILHEQGKFHDALDWHKKASAMKVARPEIWSNYANTLRALGHLEDALSYNYKALRRDPHNAFVLSNQGCVYTELGDIENAKRCFHRAIAADPRNYMAHFNLGNALLLEGNYREGFEEYDYRVLTNLASNQKLPFPHWTGETDLNGKSIFIEVEQGAGDTFQFCRLLTPLREKYPDAEITFQVADPLYEVMKFNYGHICNVVPGEYTITKRYDFRLLLMSLARVFPDYDGPPVYLRAPDTLNARNGKFSVGLCWHGNPSHKNDHNRSIHTPELLGDLISTPLCQFYSLQLNESIYGLSTRPMATWRETFSLISTLDLCITVDTSIAHVAGALDIACWLMVPKAPDWRWGRSGPSSRWYPSVKLFRQSLRGDWRHVIENVQEELLALVMKGDQSEP